MLSRMHRYWRRRRLAPIVGILPDQLARMFGGHDTYTNGQVHRAAAELGLRTRAQPFAFAACCSDREFLSAVPDHSNATYHQMRNELCELFEIDDPGFTCNHLRKLRTVAHSSRRESTEDSQSTTCGAFENH